MKFSLSLCCVSSKDFHMFCQHFVAFLSDFPKVTTQGSGCASTCSWPASNDSCDDNQKTNGDRQLPEVKSWLRIFHRHSAENDQKLTALSERIAVFYYFLCETVMFLYGRYRFLGKKKQCTLMILLNLPLRFHGGTFSDFNIAHNFSLTDKSTQSSGIYTYHKYNQKNTCEKNGPSVL